MAYLAPLSVHDTLYGRVTFALPFAALLSEPIVQRMRHIRLSNIDSVDLPGIANLSRFEHVLGVAHLASLVGFRSQLSANEALVLDAAAVLHDWAITSFGHLVEEAFQFAGVKFEHETHLAELASGEALTGDIGGIERQILGGREVGLMRWLYRVTPDPVVQNELLAGITEHIRGGGKYGRTIAGTIDLDNIDNVIRMAYHLGLVRDGSLAVRLAKAMIDVDPETGSPVFASAAVDDLTAWLETRRAVYELLMLSERDFAGKLMLAFATVKAMQGGQLRPSDWSQTDGEFFEGLRTSAIPEVKDAATRWMVGELWDMAPLAWFAGARPDYPALYAFSQALTDHMGRLFFAYGIKDKRDRRLSLKIAGVGTQTFGADSDRWLLGFGSPVREAVTRRQAEKAWAFAEDFFRTARLSVNQDAAEEPAWLI